MNEEERIFEDLKQMLLRNAPNLVTNAKRQLEEKKQTDIAKVPSITISETSIQRWKQLSCPGSRKRSKGRGKGLGRGKGKGPIGKPKK